MRNLQISPPPLDVISAAGILTIAVVVAIAWVWTWTPQSGVARLKLAIGVVAVMVLSAVAAATGVLQRFDVIPPPMAIMLVGIFAIAFALGFSPFGAAVAKTVPLRTLIGLQAFRLPLEIVMHRAGTLGIMPPELSYGGYNFDIVTGAGALLLWILMVTGLHVPRWAMWLWNLWGISCLAAIAAIAVTTSPMLRLFGDDPRHVNTWVLYFPYVWLPAVLVTVAVTAHVVITRRLLKGFAA